MAQWALLPHAVPAAEVVRRGGLARLFAATNPLVLDIGCGRGESTLALARARPHQNVVGIDVKGARLWAGARGAGALGLDNVRFVRAEAALIPVLLGRDRAFEAWILFPDPHPRPKAEPKRLTSPPFLSLYRRILSPGGRVHLKTDDDRLFAYSVACVRREALPVFCLLWDLFGSGGAREARILLSTYERRFIAAGQTIKYLCFGATPAPHATSSLPDPGMGAKIVDPPGAAQEAK